MRHVSSGAVLGVDKGRIQDDSRAQGAQTEGKEEACNGGPGSEHSSKHRRTAVRAQVASTLRWTARINPEQRRRALCRAAIPGLAIGCET